MNQDFYIGYLPKMPKSFAKVIKSFVLFVFAASISLAAILWIAQKPFAKSDFEFGKVKDFEGTIEAKPIPFLLVEKNEQANGLPMFERLTLVAEGKHGADVKSFSGQRVKLKGTLIYRDDLKMIEVAENSVEVVGIAHSAQETQQLSLGEFTLRGEIVDSKCYLGVMNPGQSKPHRDCAVACLRGGIPPLFIVKDNDGAISELWLLSESGEPINKEILDYVAEPIELTGEVIRHGDHLVFHAKLSSIKRLQ